MTARALILAGGSGSRMNHHLKKEAHVVNGRPMIVQVVSAAEKAGLVPAIVIEKRDSVLRELTGGTYNYIIQPAATGPVEAVRLGVAALPADVRELVIACGDQPFFTPETFRRLADSVNKGGNDFTLTSFFVPDDPTWAVYYQHGARLVRDSRGAVQDVLPPSRENIVTREELAHPIYAARVPFLRAVLDQIPVQTEKKFTFADLLKIIIGAGTVGTIEITDPREGIGFNTLTDIETYERQHAVHPSR